MIIKNARRDAPRLVAIKYKLYIENCRSSNFIKAPCVWDVSNIHSQCNFLWFHWLPIFASLSAFEHYFEFREWLSDPLDVGSAYWTFHIALKQPTNNFPICPHYISKPQSVQTPLAVLHNSLQLVKALYHTMTPYRKYTWCKQCKGISNTSAKWSSCWRFVQRVFVSFIFPKNPSVCQRSAFVVKTMMFHVDFFFSTNLNLLFFFSPKIGNFFFLPNSRFNFFFSSRRWWWMFRKLFLHLNGCCPPFGLFNVQSAVADCSMELAQRILNANDLGKKQAENKKQNGVDFSSETFWWYRPELLSIACCQRGDRFFTLFQLLRTNPLHANEETSQNQGIKHMKATAICDAEFRFIFWKRLRNDSQVHEVLTGWDFYFDESLL